MNESIYESIYESIKERIHESIKESIHESINESIKESNHESIYEKVNENSAEHIVRAVAVCIYLSIKHDAFAAECFCNDCSYCTAHQNGNSKSHGKVKYS